MLTLPPAVVANEILYAGLGNAGVAADGSLVTLDQTNASLTIIGKPRNQGITGLVFDNLGNLWGSESSKSAAPVLDEINPLNGAEIGSFNLTDSITAASVQIGDLAFQPVSNILFGISNVGLLYTINRTNGVATEVGDTGTFRNGGLGFAPDGTLYMAGLSLGAANLALNTLDPSTGAILTSTPTDQFFDGLAIRPSDGVIFANLAAVDGIYTINPGTGASTLVGQVGNGKVSDLAFLETIPEPNTWTLLGAGFVALIGLRRRLA